MTCQSCAKAVERSVKKIRWNRNCKCKYSNR
ncbi:heavy metal-associated domain-containing protein [Paraclostridium bifermentans]|nr:heavy metal-associated domain-containing protein [Paraclostridium bifermentans]